MYRKLLMVTTALALVGAAHAMGETSIPMSYCRPVFKRKSNKFMKIVRRRNGRKTED